MWASASKNRQAKCGWRGCQIHSPRKKRGRSQPKELAALLRAGFRVEGVLFEAELTGDSDGGALRRILMILWGFCKSTLGV